VLTLAGETDPDTSLAAPTEVVLRLLQIVGVDAVIDCREPLRQALTD
jgi:stage II sporulation protein AA (anti-sigma F factor antagonist)